MKNKFWVTGIGRSGTNKTAAMLAEATGWTVKHETADPRSPSIAHPYQPFPINRFMGHEPYGECHGFFRYNLSPNVVGLERQIPRAIIYRDLRKVITAWMNMDRRPLDELGAVIYEVSWQWQNLEIYSLTDPQCRIFRFERLVEDVDYLQDFFYHLQLPPAVQATPELVKEVVNATPEELKTFQWGVDAESLFQRVNERLWKPFQFPSTHINTDHYGQKTED
jgi:hypothetical protein